jgi:hypothetical protein
MQKRMQTNEQTANANHLKRAQLLLDLFRKNNERPARNIPELEAWLASDAGQKAIKEI